MRLPVAARTRSPLKRYVPEVCPAGTLIAYENGEKSPGLTTFLVCVAYAVVDSQLLAKAAFTDGTPQTILELSQTARLTWVPVPWTQAVLPVLAKNTANVPLSPGASVRNALSNW